MVTPDYRLHMRSSDPRRWPPSVQAYVRHEFGGDPPVWLLHPERRKVLRTARRSIARAADRFALALSSFLF